MRLLRSLPWLCAALSCTTFAAVANERRQETAAETTRTPVPSRTILATSVTSTATTQATTTSAPVAQTSQASTSDSSSYSTQDGASSGGDVDTNAGASGGSSGSFSLSQGGLIAIIVVVVLVVIFGIVSVTLWVLAKRRQWNIRASIKRASRRFTARGRAAEAADRQSKRAGLQMKSTLGRQGHKRGLVIEVKDVEKGQQKGSASAGQVSQPERAWTQRLWGNDWKR